MRLTRLIIENFRGFEQLELDLDQPVIVLVGINGSGKTTVLDAIAWCLWDTGKEVSRFDLRDGAEGRIALFERDGGSGSFRFGMYGLRNYAHFLRAGDAVHAHYDAKRRVHVSSDASPADDGGPPSRGVEFGRFFDWFKSVEDFENQERLKDANYVDPQLAAVRDAVEAVLPGYQNPRVLRSRVPHLEPAVFSVDKGDRQLGFSQFSEGERMLIALVADIARRAALTGHEPPLEAPGVVLIDEIDLHLHPGWQREVLPRLMKTFPNVQFITTTHSPIVVASVPSESIRLLKDFQYIPVGKTEGRDPNAVLAALFEVSPRPKEIQGELREVAELIDGNKLTEARQRLDELSKKLGEDDDDVRRLDGLIELLAG